MFYKDGVLNKEQKQYVLNNSYYFSLVLKDIFEKSNKYKNLTISKYKDNQEREFFALDISDKIIFSPIYLSESINSKLNKHHTITNKLEIDVLNLNKNKDAIINELKKIIGEDFFQVKYLKDVYDKNGAAYKAEFIENSDSTINSFVILDEINLYNKENELIGYLKFKYSNKEIILKLTDEIKKEDNNKQVLKKLKSDSNFFGLDSFLDIGTIDYVNFKKNGDHSGLGLATQIYLEMARIQKEKGVIFRSSSLQSDDAKKFWNRLENNQPNLLKKIKINDYEYYILNLNSNKKTKIKRNKL